MGNAIIEGKTKVVYDLPNNTGLCLLLNKDKITAGDGIKKHDMAGKAEISNATNGKVFTILNEAGMRTAYVKSVSPTAFISLKCQMIPIEWVTRRLATGSYCRRYPTVKEGYRLVEWHPSLYRPQVIIYLLMYHICFFLRLVVGFFSLAQFRTTEAGDLLQG